ncbi:hypothetical protein ASPWEDRAFT_745309 [Aspergillus wentii DTO 134E9]|uniref:Uncharacterized protein n=1 Tax=Aspergillus wentii DTO 134E9 TaxID=1073089 RepID=A0A1L9RAD9_ASPWE|nr:uncharacterized protein ASPWEDRAFT_745309 [Aspergillus wentii DTO 134E9]OJJ31868.1 hypothetical protein ASPWEDRAFT_745309 [Aspergillus wentii DTO 134E9]
MSSLSRPVGSSSPNILMYTQLRVFQKELHSMTPEDYEGKVNGLWGILLYHYFPSRLPGLPYGSLDETTGQSKETECLFLVTQCKREAREAGNEAWNEGREQLQRYLQGQAQLQSAPAMFFGIVAVGNYCTFYEFEPWENSLLAMNGGKRYHLVRDAAEVHGELMHIRDFH